VGSRLGGEEQRSKGVLKSCEIHKPLSGHGGDVKKVSETATSGANHETRKKSRQRNLENKALRDLANVETEKGSEKV